MNVLIGYYKLETKGEEELLNKILSYIDSKDITYNHLDLGVTQAEDSIDFCLLFGAKAKMYLSDYKRLFIVSSLKEMEINPSLKEATLNTINEFIEEIKLASTNKVVIEKEEVSFGAKNADILITEEEANHLLKLKEILGEFDRIVITKGELQVVLEGPKDNGSK